MRSWLLAALGILALGLALSAYHILVLEHGAEHYRLLLERPTVQEKRAEWDQVFRFPHPWNPYREKARAWLRENGHEWDYLGFEARRIGGAAGAGDDPPGR
jgi:hypothetical protein